MAADQYEIDVRPEVMLMEQVLDPIAHGELRVPMFQRPFVWRPEQILNLFDSIERGYPIGSLLIWETPEELASLDVIGDLPVPRPEEGRSVAYVLDGHQRLSALYATLRRPADARRSTEQNDWMWWTYRVLGEVEDGFNRYRHWKKAGPPPPNYLPLRSVLRTRDFLAYARELSERAAGMDVDGLIREAEIVAQRIRSYKIAVVRLVGGSLAEAVEVFSRVNSTGQPMKPAQMVSALTYRADGETLAQRLEMIVEQVADTGFGEVSSDAVFRAVLAVSGEDNVQDARWDALSKRVQDSLQEAIDDTEEALYRAVVFLRDVVGVPLARLIPYDAQLMLLTTFFSHCPTPNDHQTAELMRWFWVTSWSGHFAGANSTQIRQAIQEMRRFAAGSGTVIPEGARARPFPNRFDLRSARVRAFVIWELQEFPHRRDGDGEPISPVDILARGATSAYRHVVVRPGLTAASSPANRLIMPTAPRISVRRTLTSLPSHLRQSVLAGHGIPEEALARLAAGDEEGFIEIRQKALAERERAFMARFGLVADPIVGEADIDTD
ncbi:Protein of unknown function DUF262 [Thermomonospora echinospora]|uniref:GmrSD restriction endonucleases N-terminal domain-containing protein n=1 Tax=Thermomonospora echinospora TaxID=1992 RepID=A0A1H5T5L8_9ACTN|nr:DUF262 domain-containing protein [Thermomonospora echinospora]SEF58054.1 Protein of unknown function DUF262 [Thermomonospora echinospora]